VFSTLDLVDLAKNRKNFSGHFFEIFGVKVEKFKNILNELQEFPTFNFFDILRPLYLSTIAPKFIHFYREINFLRKCAFLDLADFGLFFVFFLSASKFAPSYVEN